jgi:peroxiredoxin family protein
MGELTAADLYTMSMDVMGSAREELIDGVAVGGVATFLGDTARSRVSLFV